MPSPRNALRVLLIGLGLLLALLWLAPAARTDLARTTTAAHAGAARAVQAATEPHRAANPSTQAALPATRQPHAPSRFIAAFQASDNLRAFVHEALRQPQQGGVFYALRALSECRRQQGTQFDPEAGAGAALGHAELTQRADWAALSQRRCAGFTADDLADAEVQRLLALGEARGDPLVAAYRGWLAALEQGSIDTLVPAMQRVLRHADPALLEWVAIAGIDYLEPRSVTGATLDDVARRRRIDAWALLPCEFGADCSRPDLGAASPCVGAGRCAGGQRAEVLARGAGQDAAERAALAAEIEALKAAVAAQDARAALGLSTP